MRVLAPAKINIHLRVGPRRPDGFHPLLSWMTTVGLFDTLNFTHVPSKDAGPPRRPRVSLRCDNPLLPCDGRNLIIKIANALAAESKFDVNNATDLEILLEKRIPIGAGLGGGSSDGAFALMALNRLWRVGGAADVLSAFAARFGSDLSFFFHGPSSVCRGRGEIVSPVPRPSARWAALVLPRFSMPTPDVYRKFDQMNLGRDRDIQLEPDWPRWAEQKSEELLPRLVNDLEPPAFEISPALGRLRSEVELRLARPVRMSGSGSSLFTLFDHQSHAADAAKLVERDLNEKCIAVEVSPIFEDDLRRE
jgi:4-diphosphocytidyl-2-C-methyl-D-erythritol kinase